MSNITLRLGANALRELIYVDTDKVRSLLSQREGGVTEDQRVTEKRQGAFAGGIPKVASREQMWGTEESTQRSLADAVFPQLEESLTAEGYLSDISQEVSGITPDSFDVFKDHYPPGSFVRITAAARLFDARYAANAFAGFATAADGVSGIDSGPPDGRNWFAKEWAQGKISKSLTGDGPRRFS
ncbi:hypothetical protein GCM10010172_14940 [Paractinoplanes ferrugineus]|uniref:Uncharacterized protein n=1 Tax=Paractinoplanes ferrugineus TaxID=113564 RepID=A0A919J0B6_9ACTN|nr:hypothetical protein [Actinoplanes ferrugineus]GIE10059.1 hypothetical protein Afe05nite_18990 [Actinoplanes ferrugineus]